MSVLAFLSQSHPRDGTSRNAHEKRPPMTDFIRSLFPSVRRTEDGASAVEYGLLVAGIAALVVAVVFLLGGVVGDSFQDTCNAIDGGGAENPAECAVDEAG